MLHDTPRVVLDSRSHRNVVMPGVSCRVSEMVEYEVLRCVYYTYIHKIIDLTYKALLLRSLIAWRAEMRGGALKTDEEMGILTLALQHIGATTVVRYDEGKGTGDVCVAPFGIRRLGEHTEGGCKDFERGWGDNRERRLRSAERWM